MAILIYDYYELRDRNSKHLKAWKVWHTLLFIVAAIAGILNYVFLQNAMQLINENCILYPRDLVFHMVEISDYEKKSRDYKSEVTEIDQQRNVDNVTEIATAAVKVFGNESRSSDDQIIRAKRELVDGNGLLGEDDDAVVVNNDTIIVGNKTHRLMLDMRRSVFGRSCEFAQYMPLMATVFAVVWTVLFIMCPGGGQARSGLQKPWRILLPALLFALVMVALTGHSFTTTNSGIQAFCSGFYNITNSTSCSSTSAYIESSYNTSWDMGARASAARAAAAALWAAWACVVAILLARCLTAPDFTIQKTGVYLAKDPENKLTPYLIPRGRSLRSSGSSQSRRDTTSLKSDPTTMTTEVATTSLEATQPTHSEVIVHEPTNDIELTKNVSK